MTVQNLLNLLHLLLHWPSITAESLNASLHLPIEQMYKKTRERSQFQNDSSDYGIKKQ